MESIKIFTGDCGDIFSDLVNQKSNEKGFKLLILDLPIEGILTPDRSKYLQYLHSRISSAKKLLSSDSMIGIYTDCRVSHHIRLLADDIFGEDSFRNELYVYNTNLNVSMKQWSKMNNTLTIEAQTILLYSNRPSFIPKYPGKWETLTLYNKNGELISGHSEEKMANYQEGETLEIGKSSAIKAIKNYRDYKMNYSKKMSIDSYYEMRKRKDENEEVEFLRKIDDTIQFYFPPSKHEATTNFWLDVPENPITTTHPDEKPIGPVERLIEWYTEPGDYILDPFLGSGTTAVAAKSNYRNFVGIEIEPQYVKMAVDRLNKINLRSEVNV
ncbi:site-specific DNA-methyltransferase [Bacillus sp. JJ1562]|uniref:site-specific DNA-methyltransferase n=1 Tax=Bacillus sp. JJ1562 TaxID=3122960 RepID=UPI003001F5EC